MTTLVEKQNHTKLYEFHGEVGHNTGECMHLKKQIEEMLKTGKLSHLIKELKQNSEKKHPKAAKKGETSRKEKALAILMVQPLERVARQKITQSFSPMAEIFFPPLDEEEGTEGPRTIEAKIGGHCIHRMANTTTGKDWRRRTLHFGSDEFHGGKVTIYVQFRQQLIGMLKLQVEGGVTLKSSRLVLPECALVFKPKEALPATKPILEERVKVPADMTGVPRHIAKHHLNMREGRSPVRQKKRGQVADRNHAIQEEVGKLMDA
nr:reverse transcriptase domain-containing protein [Tanacetum cinerariifolium]